MLGVVGFLYPFSANFLENQPVKEFGKSTKIWQSYHQEYGVSLLMEHDVVLCDECRCLAYCGGTCAHCSGDIWTSAIFRTAADHEQQRASSFRHSLRPASLVAERSAAYVRAGVPAYRRHLWRRPTSSLPHVRREFDGDKGSGLARTRWAIDWLLCQQSRRRYMTATTAFVYSKFSPHVNCGRGSIFLW